MNVASIIAILCLSATVLGEDCVPSRPKPRFDCETSRSGVFFAHPDDCTFLMLCIAGEDVGVDLCVQPETTVLSELGVILGCPQDCAYVEQQCTDVVVATPPDAGQMGLVCHYSGLFPREEDCTQAVFCPDAGLPPVLFNICNNVVVDSTFPVGCPEMCPGWKPNVLAENFRVSHV